jgi:hypothetical protein
VEGSGLGLLVSARIVLYERGIPASVAQVLLHRHGTIGNVTMDKTIRKFSSFEAVKDEEYRYWQSVRPSERIAAVYQHSVDAYRMKGIVADGQGLKELLSALNAQHVRYMVVGGYAVGVHAQPRVTKDLDIFIEMSSSNASAVYAALATFGAPMAGIAAEDFLEPNAVVRIGVPPVAVDILQHIDGVTFEQAWRSSAEYLVDDEILGALYFRRGSDYQ